MVVSIYHKLKLTELAFKVPFKIIFTLIHICLLDSFFNAYLVCILNRSGCKYNNYYPLQRHGLMRFCILSIEWQNRHYS